MDHLFQHAAHGVLHHAVHSYNHKLEEKRHGGHGLPERATSPPVDEADLVQAWVRNERIQDVLEIDSEYTRSSRFIGTTREHLYTETWIVQVSEDRRQLICRKVFPCEIITIDGHRRERHNLATAYLNTPGGHVKDVVDDTFWLKKIAVGGKASSIAKIIMFMMLRNNVREFRFNRNVPFTISKYSEWDYEVDTEERRCLWRDNLARATRDVVMKA